MNTNCQEIVKPARPSGPTPHLVDYEGTCARFSWSAVSDALAGLPQGRGLNIAHEAVDRHATPTAGNRCAIRWLGEKGERREISYHELRRQSNRFANVLAGLGVRQGEVVFSLLGRVPLLHTALFGTVKHLSVFCPLFTSFGPEPIRQRLDRGDGAVLVTTRQQFQRKVAGLVGGLPRLRHILLADADEHRGGNVWSLPKLLREADEGYEIPATPPETPALLHFTSGTTALPKGAVHVHEAMLTHYATGHYVLDFHPGDIFWCTADPGWVTGTSYAVIAPLAHGITTLCDEAEFEAVRWLRTLEGEEIDILYTSPTAIRLLRRLAESTWRERRLPRLRAIHSVGEPLDPESVLWGERVLGLPIHDNWWQTETGGIMIANFPALPIRPGSMGRPVPGVRAAILDQAGGEAVEVGRTGMLALASGWPSMFRGYLHDEQRYRRCFTGNWYLSGDLARRDADGYFWFAGRADDMIKSAGHLIGPAEVERVLARHPAVAEAAVYGLPEPTLGEQVKACITVRAGFAEDEALLRDILAFARHRLGPAVAPRLLAFAPQLPKNRAGKIMRRLLRARDLGLPEGDLSTLDNGPPRPQPGEENSP